MNIGQAAAIIAGFETSRFVGTQQSAASATAATVQRQVNRTAADSGLRRREVVNESDDTEANAQTSRHLVDIKV